MQLSTVEENTRPCSLSSFPPVPVGPVMLPDDPFCFLWPLPSPTSLKDYFSLALFSSDINYLLSHPHFQWLHCTLLCYWEHGRNENCHLLSPSQCSCCFIIFSHGNVNSMGQKKIFFIFFLVPEWCLAHNRHLINVCWKKNECRGTIVFILKADVKLNYVISKESQYLWQI